MSAGSLGNRYMVFPSWLDDGLSASNIINVLSHLNFRETRLMIIYLKRYETLEGL